MRDDFDGDPVQRWALLASALAGRHVAIAPGDPGEPAWTDGATVYVDAAASDRTQLESLTVQACLLADGALAPDLVRKLARRKKVARTYLALEGQRSLAANEEVLPRHVRSMIDVDLASRTGSAAESLDLAMRREVTAEPPASFGVIRARRLLASPAAQAAEDDTAGHVPRTASRSPLEDLDDSDDAETDDTEDPFSSPVGGGGFLGKMLQRMLSRVRQLRGGGPPGADNTTHRTHSGTRGAGAVTSTATAPADADDVEGRGRKYPEWDEQRRRYRPDWCTVQETEPPERDGAPLERPDVHALRRPLTRLGIGLDRARRQAQGDDIDIDAAVEARVEVLAGSAPDEATYLDNLRRRRDLAVLVLLDISGSVAEPASSGRTVHEAQRAAAAALTIALHELGDRVALYAFQSQGRSAVHVMPVKRFDDRVDALTMRRLGALTPGAYSRLGAAIRHGAAVITERGGTTRRLLVVLSDGLAYDHGYERRHGAADARRALAEARRQGIGCLCLTIGAETDVGELRRVFGSAAHASIPRPERLGDVIGPLFRAALRSAELRRRVR